MVTILLALMGLGGMQAGCNQQGHASHMMDGGMMGGGMMGQPDDGNSGQIPSEPLPEEVRVFRQYCGECHVPPAPSTHTASEWPGVVARMKQLMATQGKPEPKSDEMSEILTYLQRHAK